MPRILAAAVLSAFLLPAGAALAQQYSGTLAVFTTVEAVKSEYMKLTVTGVKAGESAPSDYVLSFASGSAASYGPAFEACERKAIIAMSKPGMYRLELWREPYGYPLCKLALANP
jgi:hypothetical protein